MCQLFGLNSAKPVNPGFSLRGFFQRGGGTDHHADGWGLAWYGDAQTHIQVRDTAAHQCEEVRAVLARPFRAANVIAHVRKATEGDVSLLNSHPCVRRLWGQDWVFAHNGDLKAFYPEPNRHFIPEGNTDSERAFCHVLGTLVEKFGHRRPVIEKLQDQVAEASAAIAGHGAFNFLLSDGSVLLAHCSTELYWVERRAPFTAVELVDTEESIDFDAHNDADDRMIIVATKPLTRGEAWYTMAPGELALFIDGQRQGNTHALPSPCDRTAGLAVGGWSTGWGLSTLVLP